MQVLRKVGNHRHHSAHNTAGKQRQALGGVQCFSRRLALRPSQTTTYRFLTRKALRNLGSEPLVRRVFGGVLVPKQAHMEWR